MPALQVIERKPTNVSFLYFCIGYVSILFVITVYCFFNGDLDRLKGYDDCGYICGKDNADIESVSDKCASKDMTNKKFLQVDGSINFDDDTNNTIRKKCVSTKGRMDTDVIEQVMESGDISWSDIFTTSFIALLLSVGILLSFRYAAKYIIWGINILLIIATAFIGIMLITDDSAFVGFLLLLCAVCKTIFLYKYRERLAMVVQLFKEASKALNDLPIMLAEPILTFASFIISCVLFGSFYAIIASSGEMTVIKDQNGNFDHVEYLPGPLELTAHVVNIIGFIWFVAFITGCQHFIIASVMSEWYYASYKTKLDSPIKRAFSNLCKFHLGSICLGAIVLTVIQIVRAIQRGITNRARNSSNIAAKIAVVCCNCIMDMLEDFLKYLVRNAYIVVAKDGTPLLASGKRAVQLLSNNITDVIALNWLGDVVLVVARIFVVLVTGFIGYSIMANGVGVLIACVIAFLIIHFFMTVFEMTLDTILICFCEDCEENDGIDRPYFMSDELMQVMKELSQLTGRELKIYVKGKDVEAGNPTIEPVYSQQPQVGYPQDSFRDQEYYQPPPSYKLDGSC